MLFYSVLGALCFGGFPLSAQRAQQPFTVRISAESPAVNVGPDRYTVKDGSELCVTVNITNTSKTNLTFGYEKDSRTGIGFGHVYEIHDGKGIFVPMRAIKHPEIGSAGHGWVPSRPRARQEHGYSRRQH